MLGTSPNFFRISPKMVQNRCAVAFGLGMNEQAFARLAKMQGWKAAHCNSLSDMSVQPHCIPPHSGDLITMAVIQVTVVELGQAVFLHML